MFQTPLQCCGLVYGPQEHHLDHIATLCVCLDIPLIVTDEEIEREAKLYYPQLVIFFFPYISAAQQIIQNYSIIITAMPADMFEAIFFLAKKLARKSPLTIWCPHGNSDKGQDGFFMEALSKEKIILVYGKKMLDFLNDKKALSDKCHVIPIGNYRYEFYQKHKTFYQKILREEISSKLIPHQPTYLYAPTWEDHEKASSFHLAIPHLLETLPQDINLIVKCHPNTLLEEDAKIKKLFWKYESAPNILFLEHFPLIYPLLDFVDLYIGDTSSIGYDFLSFNKPLFFLYVENTAPSRYLYECGTLLGKEFFPSIYAQIKYHLTKEATLFSQKRKTTYDYTFSTHEKFSKISQDLRHLYKQLYHAS